MKIGTKLKELRKLHGYSQTGMALKLGIAGSYLSDMENNKAPISTKILEQFSLIYNRPISVLLFQGLSREEIPMEKRAAFDIMKPAMDALLKQVFDND